jgi:type 1 glutamine amidotransferase
MIGGYFNQHPWTQNDEVAIKVEDRTHPVTRHLPEAMRFKEEIYQIKDFIGREKAKVLVSLDTANTDMTKRGIVAKEFPLVWWREYGRGRVIYNALGHRPDIWQSEWYQTMLVNTIRWAAGDLK